MKRRLLRDLAIVAAILAIHHALLAWSARKGVVAVLLAAGPHVPLWALAAAAGCLAIRLTAIVLLPAWLAVRALRELTRRPA